MRKVRKKPIEPKHLRLILSVLGYALLGWSLLFLPHLPLGLISRVFVSFLLAVIWFVLVEVGVNKFFRRRLWD